MSIVEAYEKRYGRIVQYLILVISILIVVGIGLYYALYVFQLIPISASLILQYTVAIVLGFVVITIFGREVNRVSVRLFGEKRGSRVFIVYRFFAYLVLALALLAIAGVSETGLLAGGTFAGLVVGLAGQAVLGNIIAGIMIIFVRPFEVGDRITFIASQYGLIAVSYPPKFYSNDLIMPGYTGIIRDIGLTYCSVQLDEAPLMKVPNSVMIQAAVVSHNLTERWVRTKYEVPVTVDAEKALALVADVVKKNEWVTSPDAVRVIITAATSTIYVITIDAICKGSFEEPPRSAILLDVIKTVKNLQTA